MTINDSNSNNNDSINDRDIVYDISDSLNSILNGSIDIKDIGEDKLNQIRDILLGEGVYKSDSTKTIDDLSIDHDKEDKEDIGIYGREDMEGPIRDDKGNMEDIADINSHTHTSRETKRKTYLSKADHMIIAAMKLNGIPVKDIAAHYGLNEISVYRILCKPDIKKLIDDKLEIINNRLVDAFYDNTNNIVGMMDKYMTAANTEDALNTYSLPQLFTMLGIAIDKYKDLQSQQMRRDELELKKASMDNGSAAASMLEHIANTMLSGPVDRDTADWDD